MLKELDVLHENRELSLMDSMHKVSTHENRLSQAKFFVERTLKHGNAGQVAQLMRLMLVQLESLFVRFEMPEIPPHTEFKTNYDNFAAAVKATFGSFVKDKKAVVSNSFICIKMYIFVWVGGLQRFHGKF